MNTKSLFAAFAASGAVTLGTTAALAGGAIVPVLDVAPVQMATVAPTAGGWDGGYVGGSLGYSFGGDDKIGFEAHEGDAVLGRTGNLANARISGLTAGVHAGYRWQRERWVFGPELAIEGGSVDDAATFNVDGDAVTVESKVNHIISLVMKTGYAIDPQTLVFGAFGVSRIDADYIGSDNEGTRKVGYTANGLTAGFGVERKVNASTSVFAAYQYRDYGNTTVDFTDEGTTLRTVATPDHSNIKVGVNFSF